MKILRNKYTRCVCVGMTLATCIPAIAETAEYSSCNTEPTWIGTRKAETYDVATYISGRMFEGLEIASLTFPVAEEPGVGDFSVWLSKDLTVADGVSAPDVTVKKVSVADGKVTLTLDKPYVVGAEGVYAGYSFTVSERKTERQTAPVAVVQYADDPFGHGLYIHTSRTYSKWTDAFGEGNPYVPFSMTVTGIGGSGMRIEIPDNINAGVDVDVQVPVIVYNYGISEIKSFDLAYSYNSGNAGNVHVNLDAPIDGKFMSARKITVAVPGVNAKGEDVLALDVAGVNGTGNGVGTKAREAKMSVWSFVPQRRPLCEEYTATDCGFCPRGGLGLEMLAERYGDSFVGVSYHCADVMSIFDVPDYPNPAPSQPTLWLDRIRETDPYFGDRIREMRFAADEIWELMRERFTPVSVSLDCDWSNVAGHRIEAISTVTFVKSLPESDIRMIYLVVADGLKGNGRDPRWFQGNYYSGQTGVWPSDLDIFVNGKNPMIDAVFDDVVIMSTLASDQGAALPSDIKADDVFIHKVTLDLDKAVNLQGESLLQELDRLSVVAVVYDAANGEVLNCIELHYGMSGVSGPMADREGGEVAYYNLMGIQVSAPVAGEVVLKVTTYPDGTREVKKIFAAR